MAEPFSVAAGIARIIGGIVSAVGELERMQRGMATISEKAVGPQTDRPIPEPKELYDTKTEFEDWDYCGNHKGLLFWEPSKGIMPVITERTTEPQKQLRLYPEDDWGFWMVGTDKEHVQPTVVTFSEPKWDDLARKLLNSTITVGGSGKPVGTLALNSRPAFQVSRRQVYGVSDEIEEGRATRVAVLSLREDHWKIITIGGFVKSHVYGEEMLGLTVASPFADRRKFDKISEDEIRPRASKVPATSDSSRQIANSEPVRDLAFQRGEPIGYVDGSPEWNKSQGWTLVHLYFMATEQKPEQKPNRIRGPDGELYVTTEFTEDIPPGEVWIVTAKGVIIAEAEDSSPMHTSSDIVDTQPWRVDGRAWEVKLNYGTLAPEDIGSWVVAPTDLSQPTRSGAEPTKPLACAFLGMILEVVSNSHAFLLPAIRLRHRGLKLQIESSPHSAVRPSSDLSFLDRLRPGSKTHGPYLKCMPEEPIWEIPIKNGLKAWALNGPTAKEWKAIEPKIEDIIRQTPAKSESDVIPSIAVCGLMVGRDRDHAAPTVAITCDSKAYTSLLEREMRKIGVLHGTKFKVMNLNKTIEPLTRNGTATGSSVSRPRPTPAIPASSMKTNVFRRARHMQHKEVDPELGDPLMAEERGMQQEEVDSERGGLSEHPESRMQRTEVESERGDPLERSGPHLQTQELDPELAGLSGPPIQESLQKLVRRHWSMKYQSKDPERAPLPPPLEPPTQTKEGYLERGGPPQRSEPRMQKTKGDPKPRGPRKSRVYQSKKLAKPSDDETPEDVGGDEALEVVDSEPDNGGPETPETETDWERELYQSD